MASATMTPEQERTIESIPGLDGYDVAGSVALVTYHVGKVRLRAEVLPSGRIGKAWAIDMDNNLFVITCDSLDEGDGELGEAGL